MLLVDRCSSGTICSGREFGCNAGDAAGGETGVVTIGFPVNLVVLPLSANLHTQCRLQVIANVEQCLQGSRTLSLFSRRTRTWRNVCRRTRTRRQIFQSHRAFPTVPVAYVCIRRICFNKVNLFHQVIQFSAASELA